MFCSIHDFTFLMTDTKIKGHVSFESSEKKKLLQARFSVKFVVACAIIRAGKLICLRACLHERDGAGLIDKPVTFFLCILLSTERSLAKWLFTTSPYFTLSALYFQKTLSFFILFYTALLSTSVLIFFFYFNHLLSRLYSKFFANFHWKQGRVQS